MPVGEVVSVEADQGIFHRIVVQPAVDLGALETVHVLSRSAIPRRGAAASWASDAAAAGGH